MNKNIYGAIAILGLAVGVCAEEVQFSDVPKAVQKTINRNLNGGVVKKIDKDAQDGKTFYDVGVRREGKDKEIRIDADGKMVDNPASASSSININTDKNDGKILGIVPAPSSNDKGINAEANVGDHKVKVQADVDHSHDVDLKQHDVDLNTDRDHNLNAKSEVNLNHNDSTVSVDTDSGNHKIIHKGDGKLLGIIPWKKHQKQVEVDVNTDSSVGASAGSSTGTRSSDSK